MNRLLVLWCVVALLGTAALAQAPDLENMDIVLRSVPDSPVAKVGGTNVERMDFVRLYRQELARVIQESTAKAISDSARAQLAMWCLRALVERELLYAEATERDLTVPQESVEKAWQAQLTQMQQTLGQTEGGELDEAGILDRLGYSTRDEILANIERALLTEKMRATVIRESGMSISDDEIRKIFDDQARSFISPARLHLRQIFINPKTEKNDGLSPKERAEDALGRIFAGQRFEAVAKQLSDSEDAARGGDMGAVPVDQMPPFMIEAAASLEQGEISEIVESEFGLHIIMLVGHYEAAEVSFEEAKPAIRRRLLTQQGTDVVHEYCDTLIVQGADVQIFLELDKNMMLTGEVSVKQTL